MGDAPFTGDLDLTAVHTRDQLAEALRVIRVRADNPSLRTLVARTRHGETPLSKTAVAEMLRGVRFPRKAVMVTFLRACGVPDDAMEPWRRAWEQVAVAADASLRSGSGAQVVSSDVERLAAIEEHTPLPSIRRSEDGMHSHEVSDDRPLDSRDTEISDLREKLSELITENGNLRLQLANKADTRPAQISLGIDETARFNSDQQRHAVRYFLIDSEQSEQLFYGRLQQHILNAREAIYILSRGFHNEHRSSLYEPLIQADREALRHGVEIIRIQTGNTVAASWANGYAQLVREFPSSFSIAADLDGITYNDVVLIDPHGHDPVIILLFETREPKKVRPVGRPIFALFIMNASELARNLVDHFADHSASLAKLNSQVVSELSSTYTYFAWGVHMSIQKMESDVPGARHRGKAILREWRRDIRGMLSGPADRATIQYTGDKNDAFDGVAYDLSWWGKAKLDRLERRAYEEVPVIIESEEQECNAFTYVPLPAATEKDHIARGSWIDLVVAGAIENRMTGLLAELRAGGAPIDENRL